MNAAAQLAEAKRLEQIAVDRVQEALDAIERARRSGGRSLFLAEDRLNERTKQLRHRRAEVERLLPFGG